MSTFIDSARITARGGPGGAGVVAFEKRKGKPRGKPSGGSGGSGGDVVLVADPNVASLLRYDRQPHWTAEGGAHGEGELRQGSHGADLDLPVPLGTVVKDPDGRVLADLVEPGQRFVVARGGKGGKGNAAFVSVDRRAPSFAEQGEYGTEQMVVLELRLLADAALVGFPNAGKSTLIARVSAAKPKIADYPFTTLEPHLGIVTVDEREIVLADIPGLVEGAADGKGLGHEFLRHVERARVLVILLDPTPLQRLEVADQYRILSKELERHSPELAHRPRLVVLGKTDAVGDVAPHRRWAEAEGVELYPISAVTGEGLDRLLHAVADLTDQARREAPDREGFMLHRPAGESFRIERDGDVWVVSGLAATRAVNLDDLTNPEAAAFAARRMARAGIDDALRTAGAEPGDEVRIGDLVFEYHPADGDPEAEGGR